MHTKMKILIIIAVCFVMSTVSIAGESESQRPSSWAQPVILDGVPNMHKISDTLYRSAQPTALGMENLKKMGIKTVVNLRSFHTDKDELGQTGLASENIPMKAWHPEREDVVQFLKIVTNPDRAPVLFHCLHGADRTGTLCAIYRVAVQNWTKEDAIAEMTQGGYNFHEIFDNLPDWIDNLDIGSLRKEVGIVTTGVQP